MNRYISITFRTFTIWIMTAIVNGLLCGIYLGICGYEGQSVVSCIFLTGLCSLLFAIPGFFIFWIILLLMINGKLFERALFRGALSTGIILASTTAFFSIKTFGPSKSPAISLFIILSAIISIMMHFTLFKKIKSKKSH